VASPVTRTVYPTNTLANQATNYFFSITNLVDANCVANQPGDILGVVTNTIYPIPAAPVITLQSTNCLGAPALLVASVPVGFTVDWYDAQTNLLLRGSNAYAPAIVTNGPVTNVYLVAARFDAPGVDCASTNLQVSLAWQGCLAFTFSSIQTNIVLQWYGNYVLQNSTNLTPPVSWMDLTVGMGGGILNFWTNSTAPPPTNNFFRLFGPTN
ncbi:MAG TPA: hypothetical protein VNT99_17945, partial [Methylomirabilota bacterium]|nr:hypothetical protein [Methylomirabilota bacterium]